MTPADPRIAAALARNDRYVTEFIEAMNLCPYARRTREGGRLKREVVLEDGEAALEALGRVAERFEALPPGEIDVGLAIFPALGPDLAEGPEGARAFEQMVALARKRMEARHPGGDTPFYCVPFHPHFAEDLADEHRAVRFIRRSPDPTVQFVRASVLRQVRGSGASEYVDTTGLTAAELLALRAPLPVSDRIALANLRTLRDANPERVRTFLADLRKK